MIAILCGFLELHLKLLVLNYPLFECHPTLNQISQLSDLLELLQHGLLLILQFPCLEASYQCSTLFFCVLELNHLVVFGGSLQCIDEIEFETSFSPLDGHVHVDFVLVNACDHLQWIFEWVRLLFEFGELRDFCSFL